MEIHTGNYGDVLKIEEYKGKFQIVLSSEYNGEVKPQWCSVERGSKTFKIPIAITLGDSKEACVSVLKEMIRFFEGDTTSALPGSGTPAGRYGTRRM
jgi:hypothetical protein